MYFIVCVLQYVIKYVKDQKEDRRKFLYYSPGQEKKPNINHPFCTCRTRYSTMLLRITKRDNKRKVFTSKKAEKKKKKNPHFAKTGLTGRFLHDHSPL